MYVGGFVDDIEAVVKLDGELETWNSTEKLFETNNRVRLLTSFVVNVATRTPVLLYTVTLSPEWRSRSLKVNTKAPTCDCTRQRQVYEKPASDAGT